MISINATQLSRAKKSHHTPVTFVTISVTLPTPVTFRFSELYRGYAGNDYVDYLLSITDIPFGIEHITSLNPSADTVTLRILNGPALSGTGTVRDQFLEMGIEGADVTIEELLLAPGEDPNKPTSTGPTLRFKGKVSRISEILDKEFSLECTSPLIHYEDKLGWYRMLDSDPGNLESKGALIPRPYGVNCPVAAVQVTNAAVTTLAQDMTATTVGNVKFTQTKVLQSGNITLIIGTEVITTTGKNDSNRTVTVSLRGQNGTVAVAHKQGETVLELVTNNRWAVADGGGISDIKKVSYRGSSGKLVDVTDKITKNLTDTTSIPGRTLSTFGITNTNLQAIKNIDNITQQQVPGGSVSTVDLSEDVAFSTPNAGYDFVVDTADGMKPHWTFAVGGGFHANQQDFRQLLLRDNTSILKRFRVGFVVSIRNIGSGLGGNERITLQVSAVLSGFHLAQVFLFSVGNGDYSGQSSWVDVSGFGYTPDEWVFANGSHASVLMTTNLPSEAESDTVIVQFTQLRIDQEFDPAATPAASHAGNFKPEFIAEIDGYTAPDGTYSVASGTIIQDGHDIIRHVLQKWCGVPSANLDSTWNTEGAVEASNDAHLIEISRLGEELTPICGAIADDSRANFHYDTQSGKWRFLRRRTLSQGGYQENLSASLTNVETITGFFMDMRGLVEIWNTANVHYGFNPETDKYDGLSVLAEANSISLFGARVHPEFEYPTISDQATASASLSEFIQEVADRRFTIGFDLPYGDTYDWQVGDVFVAVSPYRSALAKFRVLYITRDRPSGRTSIKCVQVLGRLSDPIGTKYDVAGVLSVSKGTKYDVTGVLSVSKGTKYDVSRVAAILWDGGGNAWDTGTWD